MTDTDLSRVYTAIDALIDYAAKELELPEENRIWVRHQIFDLLGLDSHTPSEVTVPGYVTAAEVIDELSSGLVQAGLVPATDIPKMSDKIMGVVSLDPARLQARFARIRKTDGPTAAMEWFYRYSIATNYVRKTELDRNPRFVFDDLIITINTAKPEFRSSASAQSGHAIAGEYPRCTICRDNEGFSGRTKSTLRTVPITLGGESWFWQFSPYGYVTEHGIAVNTEHTPMRVDERSVIKLLDFVDQYPAYFIGSNAALPRIGGSVLSHDHYQGGKGPLPMHLAQPWATFSSRDFQETTIEILDWYNTAIRIVSHNRLAIETISQTINEGWASYANEDLGLLPGDGHERFSAISPTVVRTDRGYEMSIILRSNMTTEEYPEGVFHAHPEFHAIKHESIGLIEAQGLFILPARLITQIELIKDHFLTGTDLPAEMDEFALVLTELRDTIGDNPDPKAIDAAIYAEIGSVCQRILENTAVFKDRQSTIDFLQELQLV